MKLQTVADLLMYCREDGDCLIWAQGLNSKGYPQASINGQPTMVRRHVAMLCRGRPLRKGSKVVSICGNPLCVSPDHLQVATASDVMRESWSSGGRKRVGYQTRLQGAVNSGLAKLDAEKAAAIRALPADVSHSAGARMFGVGPKCVSAVRRGLTWRTAGLSQGTAAIASIAKALSNQPA